MPVVGIGRFCHVMNNHPFSDFFLSPLRFSPVVDLKHRIVD